VAVGNPHVVSVVIPSVKRGSLDRCLATLHRQTRPADEILVIQDEHRRGPAWARNEGIRTSRGDLIAFTDDDCLTPPDWLANLIRAIDDYDANGAGGTLLETDPLLHEQKMRRRFPTQVSLDTMGWVGDTGNIMYRRAWLDKRAAEDGFVFNETFRVSQDAEFAWRSRVHGARFVFVPQPVTHLRRATPRSYLRHQFGRGVAIARLYAIQRAAKTSITHQPSLIWGHEDSPGWIMWLRALWYKAVGPFDRSSFSKARYFWQFWLGEKFQSLGFVWGLIKLRWAR
jgi:GT2 family glycosyltransferase